MHRWSKHARAVSSLRKRSLAHRTSSSTSLTAVFVYWASHSRRALGARRKSELARLQSARAKSEAGGRRAERDLRNQLNQAQVRQKEMTARHERELQNIRKQFEERIADKDDCIRRLRTELSTKTSSKKKTKDQGREVAQLRSTVDRLTSDLETAVIGNATEVRNATQAERTRIHQLNNIFEVTFDGSLFHDMPSGVYRCMVADSTHFGGQRALLVPMGSSDRPRMKFTIVGAHVGEGSLVILVSEESATPTEQRVKEAEPIDSINHIVTNVFTRLRELQLSRDEEHIRHTEEAAEWSMTTRALINLLHTERISRLTVARTSSPESTKEAMERLLCRMGIKDREAKAMACHSCSDEIAEKVLAKVGAGRLFRTAASLEYAYTWKLERLVGPRAIEGLQLCLSDHAAQAVRHHAILIVGALTTISRLGLLRNTIKLRPELSGIRVTGTSDTLETVINEVISNLREHGAVPPPEITKSALNVPSDFAPMNEREQATWSALCENIGTATWMVEGGRVHRNIRPVSGINIPTSPLSAHQVAVHWTSAMRRTAKAVELVRCERELRHHELLVEMFRAYSDYIPSVTGLPLVRKRIVEHMGPEGGQNFCAKLQGFLARARRLAQEDASISEETKDMLRRIQQMNERPRPKGKVKTLSEKEMITMTAMEFSIGILLDGQESKIPS